MTSGLRAVDDDFADYVRARQHQLLRAAYLVCGDEHQAEDVLESAFGALALRWRRVGEENPDLFVRRLVYRAALSRRRQRQDEPPRRLDLVPELARLTPKQRAVAVLLQFEERTEAEAAEVLGWSGSALRHELSATGRDVLDDAAEPVGERDFVERARRAAHLRRQRTRRVWAAAVAGAAALVGAVAVLPSGGGRLGPPVPTPSVSPTAAGPVWDAHEFPVLGVRAQVGPAPGQVTALPKIDDLSRSLLALPEVLGFGPDTVIPDLTELGGNSAPVRAVLLRHTEEGLRAVLVRPTLRNPFVLVDSIPLVRNVDEAGNTSEPLEVKAVANDRRHVMFLQPGKVLVLDAFTGEVKTFPVPDRYLEQGGWAGSSVIAWSETLRWHISPETGEARRIAQAAYPGRHQVEVQGPDRMRIVGFNERGFSDRTRSGPPLLSGTWGATFTNFRTNLATGGFLSQAAALEANTARPQRLFQGVLTIDSESMSSARLLIAPGSEGVAKGCCEVLGWAYHDEVLVRWNETDLLAWNAHTGALQRVSTLPSALETPPPGSAAGSVAIAP